MKAVSRFGTILLAGALALCPALALSPAMAAGQQTPPATDTDTVGPKDLQNFSLNGTVTRPADQPATTAPAVQKRRPRTDAASAPVAQPQVPAEARNGSASEPASTAAPRTRIASADSSPPPQPRPRLSQVQQAPPASSVTTGLANVESSTPATGPAVAAPPPSFAPDPVPAASAGTEHKLPLLPWLLAALALGAGGAFLFWRNRGREAFAGGPRVDAFTAPAPPPAPSAAPARSPAPASRPATPAPAVKSPSPAAGIVSTRLRPWIDIGFTPLRCILDNERVTVEFELELFNSGSGPARAVLIEASLFNAGTAQEGEVRQFFEKPVGEGERIVVIPPLKRIAITTQVVAPRSHVQAYEIAGRQVCVPVIAFNALYQWSGGEGQTSVSYLVGRDTKGEKLGPFRLDLGPRIFRGIAARLLPAGVRR